MTAKKPNKETLKTEFHARNKHRERYDFAALVAVCPELKQFVKPTPHGDDSVDFSNPNAVKALNKALLKFHYKIDFWDIPPHYLCPPIPGRADYIHHVADLLGNDHKKKVRVLDIGTGSSCIFPIIGSVEYGWTFVGTEIDKTALESAGRIIANNKQLRGSVELRFQSNSRNIFHGMFLKNEQFDLTICNPPFHASADESAKAAQRKVTNLKGKKISKPILNFGGQSNELWCDGGELRFIRDMIFQSRQFAESVRWFTTLVSKQNHLKEIYAILKRAGAVEVKTIAMKHGNKISRIVAWCFHQDQGSAKQSLNK